MDVKITGKNIDVGDALRAHVEERVRLGVAKYFERSTDASVTISKRAHLFKCDCATHLSTGLTAQASAENSDVYAACDAAVARLEKQLRRYKRRLKDHHRRRKDPVELIEATAYLLQGEDEPEVDSEEANAGSDAVENGAAEFWAPTIVAETASKVPTLSVGEAVMQLELSDEPFVLFWDERSRRANLVYRREDGHIGWIDPKPPA